MLGWKKAMTLRLDGVDRIPNLKGLIKMDSRMWLGIFESKSKNDN
jgi:hypothetical protein